MKRLAVAQVVLTNTRQVQVIFDDDGIQDVNEVICAEAVSLWGQYDEVEVIDVEYRPVTGGTCVD